jgi:hypothetical protein
VQGLSGFAFSLVANALWAWILPPQLTGPLIVFGSWVGQMLAVRSMRHDFRWRDSLPFVAGGLAGVPIGVAVLPHVEPAYFKFGLGLLLVVYCPAMLFMADLPKLSGTSRAGDAAVGWIGGVLGGIGGMTGIAPTLWTTLGRWEKTRQRATIQSFNVTMHSATLAAYVATGSIDWATWPLFVTVAPAMIIPTILGIRLYRRVSDATFRTIVLVLLSLSGVTLVAASAPTVWRTLAG